MASRIPVDAAGNNTHGEVKPAATYYGVTEEKNAPIKLRIATGGAGQSGLVEALANAFIDDYIKEKGCARFAVSWVKSDTTASFNHLADDSADLSITYHGAAEQIAIRAGCGGSARLCVEGPFCVCGYVHDFGRRKRVEREREGLGVV